MSYRSASIGQATQPSYGIKIRSLNENEKNNLRTFFADLPPSGSKEKETLEDFFSKDYQIVMEICDFGTKGLGGPLSAAAERGPPKPLVPKSHISITIW